jgi:pimeloyl-ACP methyl ester carboxylesterase
VCRALRILAVLAASACATATQTQEVLDSGAPTKSTYVRLTGGASALIVEPLTPPDPVRSRIAILVTHPEQATNFNYFTGRELAKYGYRVLFLNYSGPEQNYYEYVAPVSAGIKALRALPGVQKVVLVGHSTGGAELTFYQDVAENGAKACQDAQRIVKCDGKGLGNLPKADGVMLLDIATGAPERTMALNPAVGAHNPRLENPDLDSFSPKNGYNPATRAATYSAAFTKKYFAAQRARANGLIEEAQTRLAKVEKGESDYKDDEPFVVTGSDTHATGARLDLADLRLLSKTRAPHLFLKADGSKPVQIIPLVQPPLGSPQDQNQLGRTVMNVTLKYYLSYQAVRLNPDYTLTENNVTGVQWRSTPNSAQGNAEGIHVPTLVMAGTCSVHLVLSEITYDHLAAIDKEFIGIEGASHQLRPCRPEYGATMKHIFDYADSWLTKPGRF